MVPAPPTGRAQFAGRQGELDRLTGRATSRVVVVTAIGGTAGVGKTAWRCTRRTGCCRGSRTASYMRTCVATQKASPRRSRVICWRCSCEASGCERRDAASTEEQSGLLRQLLASLRVLMLLDNARSEVQVRPLLPGTGVASAGHQPVGPAWPGGR